MIARAFRDIWIYDVFQVLQLHSPAARAILRPCKTSLVPIYHEMHSRSYDFLYLHPFIRLLNIPGKFPILV